MIDHDQIERVKNDIKDNPKNHEHSFNELTNCCTIDGIVIMNLIELHNGLVPQRNPGGCDVTTGPCSCGAWHR